MISITLVAVEIFVIYNTIFTRTPWKKANHVAYETTSRPVWAISVGYIIFSCVIGKGGFINDILSWSIWIPLSRLSFSAYLIHTSVVTLFNMTRKAPIYLDDFNLVIAYIP